MDDKERIKELEEALADMVNQFAYESTKNEVVGICTGGLSALEDAFRVLGYTDPYPTPHKQCQADGCNKHCSCGTPTKNGYKWLCFEHYQQIERENKDGN